MNGAIAEVSKADFVWSEEYSGGSRIVHAEYANGAWDPKQVIYADNRLHILPAIATSPRGIRLAVWTTFDLARFRLMYSTLESDGDNPGWSRPRVLSERLTTNLAPFLIHDRANAFRLFWSGNDGADDDIYQSRLEAGGWSPAFRIHAGNAVPDILPRAGLDEHGNVWVLWDRLAENRIAQELEYFPLESGTPPGPRVTMDTIIEWQRRGETAYRLAPPTSFRSKSRAMMYIAEDPYTPARLFDGNLLQ